MFYFNSLADVCDFENKDLCNWANVNGSDFNWLLYKGSTPSSLTGFFIKLMY
jgi:hypothetical protein